MRNKRPLVLLLLACCLAQPVFAQATYGEPDCGRWATRKREPDKAWLLGYLSGFNLWQTARPKEDILKQIGSAEQIFCGWTTTAKQILLIF
jgi:hypothetical protein